jgi:hypothetical protein
MCEYLRSQLMLVELQLVYYCRVRSIQPILVVIDSC